MKNKILISSFITMLMCIFTLFISNNVYANDYLEKLYANLKQYIQCFIHHFNVCT